MSNEEERLSKLKQKVEGLKTSLAIKEDQKDRLLKELKGDGIKNSEDATKKLDELSDEIDQMEKERDKELEKAEQYLEQYDV